MHSGLWMFDETGDIFGDSMALDVLVDREEEGKYIENILTSKLFTYIFKTAKWSGFGNDKVFYSLPKIPHKKYTDIELFTHFGLTGTEVAYLS